VAPATDRQAGTIPILDPVVGIAFGEESTYLVTIMYAEDDFEIPRSQFDKVFRHAVNASNDWYWYDSRRP
jgi:hypothetical protein